MASSCAMMAKLSQARGDVMRKIVGLTVLALMVGGLSLSGAAGLETVVHKYIMRGQVLEVVDSTAYLCVGSQDGAQVGEEFTVYRFDRIPNPNPKVSAPMFKKQEIGKVKITEIVDEHMANAKILSGKVKVNDVIEAHR